MGRKWEIGGVTLSGAFAPERIEYSTGRVHNDIQAMDRTIYMIDVGVEIPEVRLEGWMYPTGDKTPSDVISDLKSLHDQAVENAEILCDFPSEVPNIISAGTDSKTYTEKVSCSVSDFSYEEEGGAPSHYHWEMRLRRSDTRGMIPIEI